MTLINLSLRDAADRSPMELAKDLRRSSPLFCEISLDPIGLSVALAVAPAGTVWRIMPIESSLFPPGWIDELHRKLVLDGQLTRVQKASGLRRRTLPLGLLEIDEEEKYCRDDAPWESRWFANSVVPSELIGALYEHFVEFVDELDGRAFVGVDDLLWYSNQDAIVRNALLGSGRCLGMVTELNLVSDWLGAFGLAAQTKQLVQSLEAGCSPADLLSWESLAFVSDPLQVDRSFLLRQRSERWAPEGFRRAQIQETKRSIDFVISLKARLTRLLNDPLHFRAARSYLRDLVQSISAHSLSEGLSYSPVEELNEYIALQGCRYPVLLKDPFADLSGGS